jgi:hypothetical protein
MALRALAVLTPAVTGSPQLWGDAFRVAAGLNDRGELLFEEQTWNFPQRQWVPLNRREGLGVVKLTVEETRALAAFLARHLHRGAEPVIFYPEDL